jgi:hypothetical protein
MKSPLLTVKNVAGLFAVAIVAWSMAIPVQAQAQNQAPPGAGAPAVINAKTEDRARQLSEGRLRSIEMDAVARKESEKLIQAAIVNMKEDFARIQVLRNDIARNLVARKPLDYELIAKQTAEIHKRASRLNVYMLAHSPENKEQDNASELKGEELTGALVKLCKLIDSFTENPALKNAGTVDAKKLENARGDKARADKDLLGIIKVSESIEKHSSTVSPK